MKKSSFEDDIAAALSVEEINIILQDYLKNLGIDTFAFTYYSYYPTSLHKVKFDFASAKYKAWHNHFLEEGYDDVDSTLDVVYKAAVPILWDLKKQLNEAKSGREKIMRQDSIQYGIEKGVSIPIHGPQEDFAILVLIQLRGQTWYENIAALKLELFMSAYYFYENLKNKLLLSQKEDVVSQLHAREIQCLTLLTKEYSLKEMAKQLNLTERTVNYYIQRINKKLGTKNKYQSVIRALSKGIIKI